MMRIITLNDTVKKDILSTLLKRDPNQYGQYAKTVQEIVDAVKEKQDEALFSFTEI